MVSIKRIKYGAIAVLLLAGACGSGDSATKTDETKVTSALADFFGEDQSLIGAFSGEFDEDAYIEDAKKREESIAACMKEQGFDYAPADVSKQIQLFSEDVDYGSREYAEKYGFDISTRAFSQSQVGANLVGYQDYFEDESEGDANSETYDSLDQSSQRAWDQALYGGSINFDFDEEVAFESVDLEAMSEEEQDEFLDEQFSTTSLDEDMGCQGKAFSQGAGSALNSVYDEFGEELEGIYNEVEEDPRFVEKNKEISECADKAGFDFPGFSDEGFEELEETFRDDLEEIEELVYPEGSRGFIEGGEPEFFEGDIGEEAATLVKPEVGGEFFDDVFEQPELSDEAKDKLAALQKREIEFALAVHDCGGSQEEFFSFAYGLYGEYEKKFVEANEGRLSEIKAEAEKAAS